MENAPPLGPSGPSLGGGPTLSSQRADVWRLVRDSTVPVTTRGLAAQLGLHENTVRGHLEGLLDSGLVRRSSLTRGRGRPSFTYESVRRPRAQVQPQAREYAGLATVLAKQLAKTAGDPHAAAVEAGTAWGNELAEDIGTSAATATEAVIAVTARLGFDPTIDDTAHVVRLHTCPILAAATEQPDVVCSVHAGVLRGIFESFGANPDDVNLRPFAEPGACLVLLKN